ncbi:PASTA domain-containing protein [Streptomyces katrae]|uniref:PASTA domain-containing protein n=1 Tax=Streptomyces katrae TaxID=68223 RepID=A0ABT7H2M7_9ACTN|nr:PASTA domain-containing protein [Streptomyces katrae]MDK9499384.1 PASTA domain-containing protein [Streptomyces katrae]
MRISRLLAPVAVLGALALTGCGGAAPQTADPKANTAATAAPSPKATPTAASSAPPAMPDLTGRTAQASREALAALSVPVTRITITALHTDVVLPEAHDTWYVCTTTPKAGDPLPSTTDVTLNLAAKQADCAVRHHGYLDEKNDPAYTPPPAPTTEAPAPAPAPTKAKPPTGGSGAMTPCPDGKSGYACTSNGHPVVDGQFCPNADRGRTARATNGTTVTCSYDPSIKPYRWQ